MTALWALLCGLAVVWAVVAQWRVRRMRRITRVAVACIEHWRRQTIRSRKECRTAVPVLSQRGRRLNRLQRNRGRK